MLSEVIIRTCGLTRPTNNLPDNLSEKIRVLSVNIQDEVIPESIQSHFYLYRLNSLEGRTEGLLSLVKGFSFWEAVIKKAQEECCPVIQIERESPIAFSRKVTRGQIDMRFGDSAAIQEVDYLEVKIPNFSGFYSYYLDNNPWCNYGRLDGLHCQFGGMESLFKDLRDEIFAKNLEGVLFVA